MSSNSPAVTTSTASTVVAPSPILGQSGDTVGFFGSDGVTKVTLPADGSDAGTTQALANAIKAALIAHGLCA